MSSFAELKEKIKEKLAAYPFDNRLIENKHSIELSSHSKNQINYVLTNNEGQLDLYLDGYRFINIKSGSVMTNLDKLLEKKLRIIERKASYFAYYWQLEELTETTWDIIGSRKLKLFPFWKNRITNEKYLI